MREPGYTLRDADPEREDVVYFVQGEDGGPIKIGFTQDMSLRLPQLQTGYPHKLVVRRIVSGGQHVEEMLHGHFAGLRLMGEWFEPRAELLEMARGLSGVANESDEYQRGYEEGRQDALWEIFNALGAWGTPTHGFRGINSKAAEVFADAWRASWGQVEYLYRRSSFHLSGTNKRTSRTLEEVK